MLFSLLFTLLACSVVELSLLKKCGFFRVKSVKQREDKKHASYSPLKIREETAELGVYRFRVAVFLQFQFLGYNNQLDAPVFQIDDGCQPPVELASRDRNIIAATFTTFLLKNIGE